MVDCASGLFLSEGYKSFLSLKKLIFFNPLMPREHILSLASEKGCKENAKGESMFPPFWTPYKAAAAGLLRKPGSIPANWAASARSNSRHPPMVPLIQLVPIRFIKQGMLFTIPKSTMQAWKKLFEPGMNPYRASMVIPVAVHRNCFSGEQSGKAPLLWYFFLPPSFSGFQHPVVVGPKTE